MKSLDAAYIVLRDEGAPLDKHEIVNRIRARGLWRNGQAPNEETIRKGIQVDIRKRGEASRFVQVGPGVFAVRGANEGPPDEPANGDRAESSTAGQKAAATRAAGTMSFADATERVLRDSGSNEPLHYEEIARRAIDQGLIQTEGKNPGISITSIIGVEIRRREARGEPQRFARYGRGLIGLAEWVLPSTLTAEITNHNQEIQAELLKRAKQGTPADFEQLVGDLLIAMGFTEVEVTSQSRDGGIDVRGILVVGDVVRIRMAVQAKRQKQNVQKPIVQQVRGSLGAHEQGLIITTSDFSEGARKDAARPDASPVALMNGEQFAALLVAHEVGVEKEPHTVLHLLRPAGS